MKLSQLVFKSMQKNMKHYYLYFFALIFSVTLFFSFETLQYNPSVIEATTASGTATSGFEAASYMLYVIVLIFVLYANHLFMRRRSKEIGLYQLIGMTKGLVIRLIAFENMLLFVGAVLIGMVTGLLSSRLFAMILLKVLQFDAVVAMTFSKEAVLHTAMMFSVLLVIILLQMVWIVRRSTLLHLFHASKQADERVKSFSAWQMLLGAIGLALIVYGYYKSTVLFEDPMHLLNNMLIILAATIGGTFLVFRFSVAFVFNMIRMSKKGHLNLADVLALTPIMHRMKENSKSLTLITVLTAVSLAITTLSYISYYSSEADAAIEIPGDYVAVNGREEAFLRELDALDVAYNLKTTRISTGEIKSSAFLSEELIQYLNEERSEVLIVPLSDYANVELAPNEVIVTSYNGFMSNSMPIEEGTETKLYIGDEAIPVTVKHINDDTVLTWRVTAASPVLVVSDDVYVRFEQANGQQEFFMQTAITLKSDVHKQQIEQLYKTTGANVLNEEGKTLSSLVDVQQENLSLYGTTIFVTAFLGLAFLLATGSILYFKQMSEADEEMASYTVMRKIGFTEQEILRGIVYKQLFNFGLPLIVGLLHSYFAVKSGWFLFGNEMTTPLLVTMGLYVCMYVVFARLTIRYYKKVIHQSL
ncbi:MAG: ABC transporter permease [Caryophanon sp.]|nr:ABC transporter permease [Caryophanon sp.]